MGDARPASRAAKGGADPADRCARLRGRRARTATPAWPWTPTRLGWRHLIHYNSRGTRFHAAGFGPSSDGLRIDCYDNPGDYLGSGMDGLEVYVHGNAQDQLGQITKRGKMVIYGDVGQTFLYGAKGRRYLRHGQCRGTALDQRGRPAPGRHQRHGAGLPGRVVHGGRSARTAAGSPS